VSASKQEEMAEIIGGKLVHKVIPKYPKQARKANMHGQVVLQAAVEANGNVNGVAIISGEVILAEEAVDAVRNWRFEPYTQNGAPVRAVQNITFDFIASKKEAELEPLPPPLPMTQIKATLKPVSREPGLFRPGEGVTPPKAIYVTDPAYDEKARKQKYQGVCVVSLIVGADGQPRDVKVVRAIGKGLDAKAIEAVSKWRFKPATKNGEPVAVKINVEVSFRIY
jgi:TonB family protein